MLHFEGWIETNTYKFPAMMVLELHDLNCYQNSKSSFSIKVPILQCIQMYSAFIQTTIINLRDHTLICIYD